MSILVGTDAVFSRESYVGYVASADVGWLEGWQFTAAESGVVDTLHFQVSSTVACTCTSVYLAIYSDTGDAPDALLGSVLVPGTPGLGDVVEGAVTVEVEAGTKYWLAVLDRGPTSANLYYTTATEVGDGGSANWEADDQVATPPGTWPTTSDGNKFDDGPPTIWGSGVSGSVPVSFGGLEFYVTGLWYADAEDTDAIDYYGRLGDPLDGAFVRVPSNDSRTAEVKVSSEDPLTSVVVGHTYARLLKVYCYDELILWGPITLASVEDGVLTISAMDMSARMIHHFARRGDFGGALSRANRDHLAVNADQNGMRAVRDCANNTPEQDDRGVPALGVVDGTNTFSDSPQQIDVRRGDQVWGTILSMCNSLGPDFELAPVDNVPQVYAQLNTFEVQGSDISDSVQLHFNCGKNNLEGCKWTEGSKYITHDHVLDRDSTDRVTPANLETSAETGPYVQWDITEYDVHNMTKAQADAVLLNFGQAVLAAYSHPLIECELTLPIDNGETPRYLRDFIVGDIIGVAAKDGLAVLPESTYRITVVQLNQDSGGVRTQLDVVASHLPGSDIEDDEEEEVGS